MLARDTMMYDLNRIQYSNMLYNFATIDEDIIKTHVEIAKKYYKYPIISFINPVFLSDQNVKSVAELHEYYTKLINVINTYFSDEEKMSSQEQEILVHYMVLHYHHKIQRKDIYSSQIVEYSKNFNKYLEITFDKEIFEYIKNELIYQFMIFEGNNIENYKNGSIEILINYINKIQDKQISINPEEMLNIENENEN